MDIYCIDAETFYAKDFSLSKRDTTTQSYIDDPRFEVIGVAVSVNGGEPEWCSGNRERVSSFLQKFDWENNAALIQHAHFDGAILAWKFGIRPKLILDTLSMARILHGVDAGGSLKALAERYGIGQKGDEVINAMGKRRVDFTSEELERYGEYCRNDVALTYKLFQKMAPHFNKTEIKLIDLTVRMFTESQLELDISVLREYLDEIRADKEALLAACEADKNSLLSNNRLADLLQSFGVSPPMKVSARTGKETFAFAKSDKEFQALLEHEDPRVQAVVAARLGVKSTIAESRTERFINIAESNGGLPVPLKYAGAMSHRWSGIDSVNLQNLPRGSKLKEAIRAPHGFVLVGADLSNIELRVGLYFAGQFDKLALLADGVDLYKDFASSVFNVPLDEVTKDHRFIGKCASLSLIYGTGAAKLRGIIQQLSGVDIGEEEATRIVDVYRKDYHRVKAAWHDCKKALDAMTKGIHASIGLGPIKLDVEGHEGIRSTSGMFMRYPELSEVTSDEGRKQWRYKTRKGPVYIHPAKCYQNICQNLARNVMGESAVRIQQRYPASLMIHDALYCVVPEADAESALAFMISEMTTPPLWAPNLPLAAEGGWGYTLKDAG